MGNSPGFLSSSRTPQKAKFVIGRILRLFGGFGNSPIFLVVGPDFWRLPVEAPIRHFCGQNPSILRLKVTDMLHALSERDQLKGEATVALFRETSKSQEESLEMTSRILDAAGTMVERGLSRKDAQRAIAQLTGISKRRALELVLQATEDPDGAG